MGSPTKLEYLNSERNLLRLRDKELADKLGVSVHTLRNWIQGKTDIPAGMVSVMMRIFSIERAALLDKLLQTTFRPRV